MNHSSGPELRGQLGLHGMTISEEYGGSNLGYWRTWSRWKRTRARGLGRLVVRGFGHVKERNQAAADAKQTRLLAEFSEPSLRAVA